MWQKIKCFFGFHDLVLTADETGCRGIRRGIFDCKHCHNSKGSYEHWYIMIRSFDRGHSIIYLNSKWVYEDTLEELFDRPCIRCGQLPIEGHDACLGYIEGCTSACCGHGVEEPYQC